MMRPIWFLLFNSFQKIHYMNVWRVSVEDYDTWLWYNGHSNTISILSVLYTIYVVYNSVCHIYGNWVLRTVIH
jgi:hypothetical protein